MRRLVSSLALAASLAGCTSLNGLPPDEQRTAENGFGKPKWNVLCETDQHDPYGKLTEKANCEVTVTYYSDPGAMNDWKDMSSAEPVFQIDAKGSRLVMSPTFDADACPDHAGPHRQSVDGKEIDQLPMPQRIQAVLTGSVYVREADNGFPDCNLYNEGTPLDGVGPAYQQMVAQWKAQAG